MSSRKIVKSKYWFEEDYIETFAEVPVKDVKSWGKKAKLKIVGKPIPRKDGYDKVSGSAQYTFDVILPRMAFAKTLRCPFPHARIKSINISKAEKLSGVFAIISNKNTDKIPWYGGMSSLFDPLLRFEGDEVACVAAKTEKIAEEAISLIEVEYEQLPFVIDAAEAMKKDAPKVHETNIMRGKPDEYKRGDVEKGLSQADVMVEDTFTTPVVIHHTTEVHCSVVNWDGDNLTVWDSTQAIFSVRDAVASALKMPASHVRVIKKFMGGGFGSKLAAGKYTVMAALLAKKIGRPVKIAVDRKTMNLAVGNRPDSVQKLKLAAKNDGTLTAMIHESYGASGAYPSGARCSIPFRTVYKCPNLKSVDYSVFINTGPGRPKRAPGHVQGTFAMDSIVDDLAEKIGMDPLDFRIKNYAEVDPVSNKPWTTKRLKEAYTKGAKAIGWYERRKPAGFSQGPMKHGIGMATQIWGGTGGPPAYANLKLNRDGSVKVIAGSQDLGTGTYTHCAMVASEVLQVPLEKIDVILGDTGVAPYCGSSGGSNTTPSVSPAVRDAAEQMKAKLMSGAAAIMETTEDQLVYKNAKIFSKQDDKKSMEISQVVRRMRERVMITTGARGANPDGYARNTFGAQFAEVEVDTETGKINVVKIVAAHDIGRVLNPKTCANQVYGGVMMGLGFALLEERVLDDYTGKMVNANMHDYKLPTVMDTPEIEVIFVSDSDPLINITGTKGVGEPAIIPTAGAIANAIYNAIGVRIKSLPITPDKVLTALYG